MNYIEFFNIYIFFFMPIIEENIKDVGVDIACKVANHSLQLIHNIIFHKCIFQGTKLPY